MIKVRIAEQVYFMPSVEEITLDKGCQVERITTFFDHSIGTMKRGLSVLMDCPVRELNKVQDEQIEFLYKNLIFFDNTIGIKPPKGILISGIKYSLIDFKDLSTYEFAELEYLLKDAYVNAAEILAVLFRPSKKQRNKAGKNLSISKGNTTYTDKQEPVSDLEEDYSERAKLFQTQVNFYCAKAAILTYIEFRVKLLEDYGMMDTEELPADQIDEVVEEQSPSEFPEVWGVYYLLDIVSGGIISEQDIWLKKPANQFLKRVFYIREKEKWQKS